MGEQPRPGKFLKSFGIETRRRHIRSRKRGHFPNITISLSVTDEVAEHR
jgi:hypothetical protein